MPRKPTFFSDLCRHVADVQVFNVQLPQVAQLPQLGRELPEARVAEGTNIPQENTHHTHRSASGACRGHQQPAPHARCLGPWFRVFHLNTNSKAFLPGKSVVQMAALSFAHPHGLELGPLPQLSCLFYSLHYHKDYYYLFLKSQCDLNYLISSPSFSHCLNPSAPASAWL